MSNVALVSLEPANAGETVNIIAIAQGSSEITIAIVVRRAGLEKAVRAVHEECGLGR
jgi:aspartokinase